MCDTAFVLVTDESYLYRAKKTIIDLRSKGQWHDTIVLICIGSFDLNPNFVDFYDLTIKRFPEIEEKHKLQQLLDHKPFSDTIDGREITKINQWEKLHVFDPFFCKWERIVFLDAGLRILDKVSETLLEVPWKGKLVAPNDGGNYISNNVDKLFNTQISNQNKNKINQLMLETNNHELLSSSYFLNCIWIYDTSILEIVDKKELICGMLEYPICKTNEMTLMNIYFHFKYHLWEEMPVRTSKGKILFEWCETNNPIASSWREYCCIKYPNTISFDDT